MPLHSSRTNESVLGGKEMFASEVRSMVVLSAARVVVRLRARVAGGGGRCGAAVGVEV